MPRATQQHAAIITAPSNGGGAWWPSTARRSGGRRADRGACRRRRPVRRGIFSLTDGYTRNSYELARTLLTLGRPADAIAVLQPAFRGSLQGSNLYITHTELHEVIAQAFEQAGQPDSAAAHYRYVVRAWTAADPPLRTRRGKARARLVALTQRN